MKALPLLLGGLSAGLVVLAGEFVLNLAVLNDEMAELVQRFALPQPTPTVLAQAVLRLLLLGVFAVWLALKLERALGDPHRSAIVSGLCIWLLAWAWVQWALVNTGFVTTRFAVISVAWGLFEVPMAAWSGSWIFRRLSAPSDQRQI